MQRYRIDNDLQYVPKSPHVYISNLFCVNSKAHTIDLWSYQSNQFQDPNQMLDSLIIITQLFDSLICRTICKAHDEHWEYIFHSISDNILVFIDRTQYTVCTTHIKHVVFITFIVITEHRNNTASEIIFRTFATLRYILIKTIYDGKHDKLTFDQSKGIKRKGKR